MNNRYSRKEKRDILEEIRQSDLSVVKFAKEKGIPASTIFTWIKKEKEYKQATEESLNQKYDNTLVEVVLPKKNKKIFQDNNTENKQALVLACNGCAVQISDNFNQDTLKRVLQVVQKL